MTAKAVKEDEKNKTESTLQESSLYRFEGSDKTETSTHLENCTEKDKQSGNEELLTSRSSYDGFYRHHERKDGLIKAKKIKQIRAQGGCPGTDCR